MSLVKDILDILDRNEDWKNMKTTASKIKELESRLTLLEGRLAGNPDGYCCDSCGSRNITRTGNRDDPTFGALGIKQSVFTCADCGTESAFTSNT